MIGPVPQGLIIEPDVLLAVTLQDKHNDIAGREGRAVGGLVEWGIEGLSLLVAHVVGDNKGRFFDCAENRKWCVQHNAGLGGTIHILVGVADGDGACRLGETTANGADTQRDGQQQ